MVTLSSRRQEVTLASLAIVYEALHSLHTTILPYFPADVIPCPSPLLWQRPGHLPTKHDYASGPLHLLVLPPRVLFSHLCMASFLLSVRFLIEHPFSVRSSRLP